MTWHHLIVTILRGVLRFVADEYYPVPGRVRKGHKRKAAPPPPRAEKPAHSAGWAPPKEAPPVTVIRLETDAGSTVAAASFIGEECFGVTKVQRERQPGESRRTRRKAPAAPASTEVAPAVPSLRDPQYAERLERMRQWGIAEHARQQADFEDQAAEVEAQRSAPTTVQRVVELPPASRLRPAGEPLSISWLAPETLLLLELGEPLTYVHAAA